MTAWWIVVVALLSPYSMAADVVSRCSFTQCGSCENQVRERIRIDLEAGLSCLDGLPGKGKTHSKKMKAGIRRALAILKKNKSKINVGCSAHRLKSFDGESIGTAIYPTTSGWPSEKKLERAQDYNNVRPSAVAGSASPLRPAIEFAVCNPPETPSEVASGDAFHELMHFFADYRHPHNGKTVDVVYACEACCFFEKKIEKNISKAPETTTGVSDAWAVYGARIQKMACEMCAKYSGTEEPDPEYFENYAQLLTARGIRNPFSYEPFRLAYLANSKVWTAWLGEELFKSWDGKLPEKLNCALVEHVYMAHVAIIKQNKEHGGLFPALETNYLACLEQGYKGEGLIIQVPIPVPPRK